MADFNFLRVVPVDLARYLPLFLEKDPTFSKTLKALSTEHEKQRLRLIDVTKQFFITTATWGLADWEEFLDLHPDPGDSDEKRRARVLIALRGSQTTTLSRVRDIINAYGNGYVEEHNDQYYFIIFTTRTDDASIAEMRNTIEIYKPAHLGCYVYLGWSWDGKITFDGKYTYGTNMDEWSGNNNG